MYLYKCLLDDTLEQNSGIERPVYWLRFVNGFGGHRQVCTMRSARGGVVLMIVDVWYNSVNGAGGRQVMSGRQGAHLHSTGLPTAL